MKEVTEVIEIVKFRPEEIDEAIEGLDGLRDIIAPVLRRINGNGMGEQDAQQFIRQLTLAKHALIAMGGFLEGKMAPEPLSSPLTLEQLREMDGNPVWVEMFVKGFESHWAIVHGEYISDGRFVTDKERCLLSVRNGGYGEAWLAYDRRPEEGVT